MAKKDAKLTDSRIEDKHPIIVVGVGSAGGGLNSLKQFFSKMSTGHGVAFVLIQHVQRALKNPSVKALKNQTALAVAEATDGMPVLADRIYIIPPDKFLNIAADRLTLQEPVICNGLRMPIDHFFCSLAVDQRRRSIGILLAGKGSDGTLGLSEIKAMGGRTIVEDPGGVKYPTMAKSAIDAGVVDSILPAADMAEAVMKLAEQATAEISKDQAESSNIDPDLRAILDILSAKVGHDFHCYKSGTLIRRIRRRMSLAKVASFKDYANYLNEHPEEVGLLQKDLLIGVTDFFRQPHAWETLEEKVIAPLVEGAQPESEIRIWVPGCSTGNEAYSLAMLLSEQIEKSGKNVKVQIFATDSDLSALATARSGVYSKEDLGGNIPQERLKRFFKRRDGHYQVIKDIREQIVFAPQNITADPPFSRLDLISCRNLLIYLDQQVQKKIISLFHFSLREGGFLFLGTAETVGGNEELFEPVSKKWRVYRRIGIGHRLGVEIPVCLSAEAGRTSTNIQLAVPRSRMSLLSSAQQVLLDRFTPACVMIDRKLHVLYVHGVVEDYLTFPPGELTTRIVDMAREGLRARLRGAITKCLESNKTFSVTARVRRGDKSIPIKTVVSPLRYPREIDGLLLITFEDYHLSVAKKRGKSAESGDTQHLMDELKITREELQSTIDQLENSNDELKASNEEVTATNEELQSANEELETSKEELQSLNEELNTINTRLQEKVDELEGVNNDVINLLSSTDIATVFLDKDLRVKRYTPAITRLFSLIPSDIGRYLGDVLRKFSDEALLSDARRVLANLTPLSAEVQDDDGRWHIRRITPYRTHDDRIEGVVITLVDVNDLKRAQNALRRLNAELEERVNERTAELRTVNEELRTEINERKRAEESVVSEKQRFYGVLETLPAYVILLTPDYHVSFANRFFRERFGEAHGRRCYEYLFKRMEPCEVCETYTVLKTGKPHHWEWLGPDGCNYDIHDYPFTDSDGAAMIMEVGIDITDVKKAEAALREANETLEQRVAERTAKLAESEARYRTVADFTYDWEFWISPQGRFLYASPSVERISGRQVGPDVSAEEFLRQIVHPDDLQRRLDHLQEELAGSGPGDMEFRILRPDGEVRCVHHVCRPIYDAEGSFLGTRGSNRDITERKQAEEALQESQKRLALIGDSIADGVYAIDPDWRFTHVNDEALRHMRKTREEILGRTLFDVYPDARGSVIETEFSRAMKSGEPGHFENHSLITEKTLEVHAYPGIDNLTILFRDVTERKQAEKEIHLQNSILDAMNRIFQKVITCDSEEGLGELCLDVLQELTQSKIGFIGEMGPDGLFHDIAISNPGWEACLMYDKAGHRRTPGDFKIHGIYGSVLKDGKSIIANDPPSHPESIGIPEGHPPLASFLGVPLILRGRTVGMVAVGNRKGGYTEDQRHALEAIAPAILEALARKRAEAALRDEHDRSEWLARFPEENPNPVMRVAAEGKVLYCNPASAEIHGWPCVVGKQVPDLFLPLLERAMATGRETLEDIVLGGRFYSVALAPFPSEGYANIYGLDITARKQAEENLRESEGRLRLAQASAGAGMWDWDIPGGKLEWSEELFGLFGLDPKKASAGFDSWRSAIYPEDRKIAEDRIGEAIENGTPLDSEYRIKLPSGEVRWIRALGSTIHDDNNKPLHMSGICLDVTTRKQAEQAVHESEERLRLAVGAAKLGVFEWNVQADKAIWDNDRMYEIFGLPPGSEAVNRKRFLQDALHPDDFLRFEKEISESMRSGGLFLGSYRIRRFNDGELRWIEYFSRFETGADGKVTRLLGVLEDITERKLTENALQKSEEQFRLAIKDAPIPVIMYTEDGQVLQISNTWTELTGYTTEDMPTFEAWLNRAYGEGAEAVRNHMQEVFSGTRRSIDLEFEIHTRDGQTRHWSFSASAPGTLADGRRFVVGMAVDITERKQAGEAISRAKKEWERTFDAVPDLIAILDDQYRILRGNKAMADRLGLTPSQCIGKNCHEAVHGTDCPPAICPHALSLADGQEHVAEVHEESLGGDFLVSTTPLTDEQGRRIGSVHVARDITKRKQAEEALKQRTAELEAANKELESFSYSVSHDLRAPLRAIDGYARMIFKKQGDKFDEDTKRKFNDIRSNAQMMGHLIDDLLAFSRLGKKQMSATMLSMDAVITDVWKELQIINPGRDMKLTLNSMPAGYGDKTLIKQVYLNLLSNAVKFTKSRDVARVEVGGYKEDNEDVYYVRDNGVGFDMAYYDKLFGVFQRLHKPDEFEGTGVGLATVQRIIHRHEGRVWAEGKVNEGATFYFTLPMKR